MSTALALSKRAPKLSEADRIKGIADLGKTLEPVGVTDTVTIAVSASLYGVTGLLVLYALIHRNYRPIRAKNMPLTTVMYIACIVWFLGDIATNGLVYNVGVWSKCKLWVIWFRDLGGYLYSSIVLLRAHALNRIFIQRKSFTGWAYYMPIVILAAALLIFCLTVQLISDDLTVSYLSKLEICHYVEGFKWGSLALLWLVWFASLFYYIKIRHIQTAFNEFREALVVFFIAFTTLLETSLVHGIFPTYPLNRTLRTITTYVDVVCGNISVWVFLVYPVFKCIFYREKYEHEWLAKLARDGLQREYQIEMNRSANTSDFAKMGSGHQLTSLSSNDRTYATDYHITLDSNSEIANFSSYR
ncbi:hypothetical protein DL89DRAFT_270707 [Linderina pennispora]|uniref:G-protein coupled receptors family 3 profile domain-containing protein n=1 Tax=Linderina pennispora TaxID=61395 RepID=A0A1Y1VXI4_9FUNG|nr:uncharacterized protein DL89DRAFT_270707 [Linderina pennispora]ORX65745.1 hypothetical protein DL89DRAFT_270707 [Linderina pennispora]